MSKQRSHFSGREKVAILLLYPPESATVSELCEEYGLRPTAFYRWQQQLFESGAARAMSRTR